ncbi:hypothetical protein NIES4072_54070 [Nostoc commune NIES-4072]|uniref:Uncharacterized protein n=1 Tax=Nostoc commune NIES-4072 TaxID=2005467 RepID=A0A2R5FUL2_NOSCO|nr:hypothetical protein [Nostoc commune]BBD67299.1 hypothetical protein NIES4070_36880 [Nostoc commune HK-02]GBG21719.1 hypothetical protein NIES4072_54070 [Nostoc commune NIES-4072]
MSIPNERESKNSEIKQESYTDINGNIHTDLTRTTETVKNSTANPNSYTNGYVQGRNVERSYQQEDLAQRDENNASGGLLLGIILTSILGLIIGGVWYFNQQNNAAVDNTVPVAVPVPTSSPTPSASPQTKTTIIERTREVPVPVAVPVPQQQVTPPSAPRQPDINITIPPQQPAAEKAPSVIQPTPKATQSPTTNTVAPSTKSDTSKTTPPQGVDQSNSTSNSGSSTADDTTTGGSAQ